MSNMIQEAPGAVTPERQARNSKIRIAFTPLIMGVVLFWSAGRLDWWAAWIFISLVLLIQVRVVLTLQRTSPDLLMERDRMREGTKQWDKPLVPLIVMVLPMAMWMISGLDLRNGWSEPFSAGVQTAGFVLAAVSAELTGWAMATNRFFSATVRIQSERGHKVVSTGPYAVVRHPGCGGMIGFTLMTPIALGSPLAFIPAILCTVLLVVRTALEDRTLKAELDGYTEYAGRVRSRLIPLVW